MMRWNKKTGVGAGMAKDTTDKESPVSQSTVLVNMNHLGLNLETESIGDAEIKDEEEELKASETSVMSGGEPANSSQAMVSQYLALERSEGGHSATTQVVKMSANGQLVSCEMLPHVAAIDNQHGVVVHVFPPGHAELKETTYYAPVPSAQHLQRTTALIAEDRYLAEQLNSPHYEEDLLTHDLSEDDRRLAAALMAVQYSSPQNKQLNKALLESGNLVCASTTEGNVIMNVGDGMQGLIATSQLKVVDPTQSSVSDMVVEYIQQVEGTASADPSQKQMRLVTYHTDGPVVPNTTHEQQLHALDEAQLQDHQIKTIIQTPPAQKRTATIQLSPRARYKRSLEEQTQIIVSATDAIQETKKSSVLDSSASVEGDEDLEVDSDAELESSELNGGHETRSSKRSLPHKKRIPRKLKNPKQPLNSDQDGEDIKCNKCDETFQTQTAFASHKHPPNKKVFNCEICGKIFTNQLKFFEHLKVHYEPIMVNDETLEKIEEKSAPEEREIKVEPSPVFAEELPPAVPPSYACMHCNKAFRRYKALETHINLVHSVIEDESPMDDSQQLLSEDLVDDLKKDWYTHHELTAVNPSLPVAAELAEKEDEIEESSSSAVPEMDPSDTKAEKEDEIEHACDHCSESFVLKSQLIYHMREEHPGAKRKTRKKDLASTIVAKLTGDKTRKWEHLTCPTCGRLFNHRNSLIYHLRSHTGERPHQCEVCGKSFFAASALKVHMRLHSGDKPYKCELCERHFRQWGDLKYHCISIHTDEKQYQCEYCGKDFARKYSLIVHRRIHTGEKNYKCEFCSKTFRASSYLQNHRRIHTGEKPHPCDICGKPFRVRSDMKRHMHTHNKEHQPPPITTSLLVSAAGNSQSSHSSSQGAELTNTSLAELEAVAPEIEIHESVMTEESLASQPISLGSDRGETVMIEEEEHTTQTIAEQQMTVEEVQEDIVQYTRDPLETVRDGQNTLYVWPVYMA